MIDKNFNTLIEILDQIETLDAHLMRLHCQVSLDTLELVSNMVNNSRSLYTYIEQELNKNGGGQNGYGSLASRIRTPAHIELDIDA